MNKKHGRRHITCVRCKKVGLNYGFNMCSACVRKTKRETKPSYYLGTCYSEMTRRVKRYDPLRKNYYGKLICTKEQFMNKFLTDVDFLNLFKKWQQSNFKRGNAPSIDRINNNGDYNLENIRFIVHTENTGKDVRIPIVLSKDCIVMEFDRMYEAAKFLEVERSTFTIAKQTNKTIKGWKIYEY